MDPFADMLLASGIKVVVIDEHTDFGEIKPTEHVYSEDGEWCLTHKVQAGCCIDGTERR